MTSPIALPLDFLRGVSEAFLPQTCAVSRYTETNTPDGVEEAWATVATGIRCRVSPRPGSVGAENVGSSGSLSLAVSEWVVWLPYGTDVTARDRLVVDPPDGRVFEVIRVGIRSYEVAREVLCALVT